MKIPRIVLTVVIMLVATGSRPATADDVVFLPRLLYDRVADRGVAPVVVELRVASTFRGSIRVRLAGDGARGPVVREPLNVGRGQHRVELPYPLPDSPLSKDHLEVALLDRFGRRLDDWPDLTLSPVISDAGGYEDTGSGDVVTIRRDFAVGLIGTFDTPLAIGSNRFGNFHCSSFAAADAPKDWRMYEGLDLVVVAFGGGDAIPSEPAAALADWVRAGGRLLVAADASTRPENHLHRHLKTGPAPPEIRRRSFGTGQIAEVPDHFGKLPPESRAHTLSSIVAATGILPLAAAPTSIYSYYGNQPNWVEALRNWTDLTEIPCGTVFFFLVLFVVAVTLGERLLLRRLRRPQWTWITTVTIVVVFCYLASWISVAVRGRNSRLTTLVLHDYGVDGGGRVTAAACFIPARSRSYKLAARSNSLLLRESYETPGDQDTEIAYRPQTFEFAHPVWGVTYLISHTPHADSPPFAANLYFVQGSEDLRGQITSGMSQLQVREYLVCHNNVVYRSSDGQHWQFRSRMEHSPPVGYDYGIDDHDADRETAILNLLPTLATTGLHPATRFPSGEAAGTMLIAVCHDLPVPFTLDDPDPITKHLYVIRQQIHISQLEPRP